MARLDVFHLGNHYVLDVQTDLVDGLSTRLVVPLIEVEHAPLPASRLNPVLEMNGDRYALQPQLMAAASARSLGRPVDNVLRHYDRIVAAIDMIFNGF